MRAPWRAPQIDGPRRRAGRPGRSPRSRCSVASRCSRPRAALAARLTGWKVDIKSETQLAEESEYGDQDWAEGEWVEDPETGEMVWKPAEGGEAISAEQWQESVESGEPGDATETAVEPAETVEPVEPAGEVTDAPADAAVDETADIAAEADGPEETA